MVKLIITLLNIMVILALQIFPGGVSVKLDVPTEVQAGSEFEVKVTLNKGDLDGFSRFQQSMPAGLTAIAETTSNADFSFSEKRVRLIWLRTPQNDEITVTYRIRVDERLKGTFVLGGKFSYIDNNERKSVDADQVNININPSPTVDPSLIVDVNDFEKMTIPSLTSGEAVSVACIRQKPYAGAQGDYIVNVLVTKNLNRQFAKIEEMVPEGYTAVAVDAKDAIFTFKDQKAKFLWMTLPTDPFFTVSYRLIPKNQARLSAPAINGAFSYLVDEKTVSVDIVESDMNFANVTKDNVSQLVAEAIAQQTQVLAQAQTQDQTKEAVKKDSLREKKPSAKTEGRTKKVKPASEKTSSEILADASSMLNPEQGIYYRVQLAAGHKPINIDRYFRKMKLDKEVRHESHNGWTKYSVGSFGLYKDARDYRVHVWNTTPVKDAFITAYNSGQRITVQEALMITEQKWYR